MKQLEKGIHPLGQFREVPKAVLVMIFEHEGDAKALGEWKTSFDAVGSVADTIGQGNPGAALAR